MLELFYLVAADNCNVPVAFGGPVDAGTMSSNGADKGASGEGKSITAALWLQPAAL
ncbi:MAG: hypothetical protein AB4352_08740 [Hormoscilla sp.]